ncbi:PIN domain-containing protein [Luteolibacter sp. SL250]|uniref:PIN domain-containing protein n=1 Tax=Luteolibacter sp. SL250 TaxID=2995170 RepID=UPI00226FDBB6|nr:PIN domain-containing protein [Luteolibacter sp. SL250]WAC20145.1 PIN domain-containing protein [Luteolibacter sp. SL250]
MSAEVFLDTNVIVYSFDQSSPAKRERSLELLRGDSWAVSWQVVQEFASVALHRFKAPMSEGDLADYIELILMPHCRVFPSASIYRQALAVREQTGYRFYDSLVVTAALESGAKFLYSEDLQHGRKIGGMMIVNPFSGA